MLAFLEDFMMFEIEFCLQNAIASLILTAFLPIENIVVKPLATISFFYHVRGYQNTSSKNSLSTRPIQVLNAYLPG